jgi:hypothetical protein
MRVATAWSPISALALPPEWEALLADAAVQGRMVYQVKQLVESLTGPRRRSIICRKTASVASCPRAAISI